MWESRDYLHGLRERMEVAISNDSKRILCVVCINSQLSTLKLLLTVAEMAGVSVLPWHFLLLGIQSGESNEENVPRHPDMLRTQFQDALLRQRGAKSEFAPLPYNNNY